jgi:hypothetical protein
MEVTIKDVAENKLEAVKDAAREEWGFREWDQIENMLVSYHENQLCGGESEEEFVNRLAAAVWDAHSGFCEISVDLTYLEDLPIQNYIRSATAYEKYVDKKYFKKKRKRKGKT